MSNRATGVKSSNASSGNNSNNGSPKTGNSGSTASSQAKSPKIGPTKSSSGNNVKTLGTPQQTPQTPPSHNLQKASSKIERTASANLTGTAAAAEKPRSRRSGTTKNQPASARTLATNFLRSVWSLTYKLHATRTGAVLYTWRLMAAMWFPMSDCDETFNYWEPLHYLMYRSGGKQTWEYSSEYALRSYFFLWLYGWPIPVFEFLSSSSASKVFSFYLVRCVVATLTTLGELFFIFGIAKKFGGTSAVIAWVMLLVCTGPSKQGVNFLPSSFAMSCYYVACGAWLLLTSPSTDGTFVHLRSSSAEGRRGRDGGGPGTYRGSPTDRLKVRLQSTVGKLSSKRQCLALCILTTVMVPILGWPFAALVAIPMVIHILNSFREWIPPTFGLGIFFTFTLIVVMVTFDSLYYCKIVFASLNILLYNVFPTAFGSGGGNPENDAKFAHIERGPELYGVEPPTFFFKNLFLNFNVAFLFALLSLPLALVSLFGRKLQKQWAAAKKKKKNQKASAAGDKEPLTLELPSEVLPPSDDAEASSGSLDKHPVNAKNLLIYSLPFYLYFVFWLKPPHKEERFFAPCYPYLILAATLSFYFTYRLLRSWLWPAPLKINLSTFQVQSSEPMSPAGPSRLSDSLSGSQTFLTTSDGVLTPPHSSHSLEQPHSPQSPTNLGTRNRRKKSGGTTTSKGDTQLLSLATPNYSVPPALQPGGTATQLFGDESTPPRPTSPFESTKPAETAAQKAERKQQRLDQIEREKTYLTAKKRAAKISGFYLYFIFGIMSMMGASRTLGEVFFYSGVERALYNHFTWRSEGKFDPFDPVMADLMQQVDEGLEGINVKRRPRKAQILCLGEDWFRFPSSFFLPRHSFDYEFLKTRAFSGALPKNYQYETHGPNATCVPNIDMNDLNQEDVNQYVPGGSDSCDFILESSPSLTEGIDTAGYECNENGRMGDKLTSTEIARYGEKRLASLWSSEVAKFEPLSEEPLVFRVLDAGKTPMWCRMGWLPFITERCAVWTPVVIVKNTKKRQQTEMS